MAVKEEEIVASLDLGTTSVKCVVGLCHPDGQVDIIGTGSHPAKGLKAGQIANRAEASRAIRQAVKEAELVAGCDLKQVYASISGQDVQSFNSPGVVRIQAGVVTPDDVNRVVDVAQAVPVPGDREVLHVVPGSYTIDHERGILQPLGMNGVRLEVEAHLVVGAARTRQDIEACCRDAGLKALDLVLPALAASETLLTSHDRELGVLLLDIGGGSTDLAVFQGGSIKHSAMIPLGGEHVTADVHECLRTPLAEAERMKQVHGCALASLVGDEEHVELPPAGGRRPHRIKRALLCQIIEARLEEILKLVGENLDKAGYREGLPGGIVLTGGSANMPGVPELTEQVLGMQAARGMPQGVEGLVDVIKNPRYSTGTGLVLCATRGKHSEWTNPRQKRPHGSFFGRLFGRSR